MGLDWNRPAYGVNWAALVTPFLLPVSYLWDVISYWSILIHFWLYSGAVSHSEKVRRVQEQVRRWGSEGRGRKMCTARPSWMSISQQTLGYKDRMFRVRVDFLQDIVKLDREKMTVSVEPNITIGLLNRFLVQQGLTLPVVPELDNLTVGGLVAGGGIESTSHKYGLFHHTATEFEVVLGNGEVITCNKGENADYFHAIPMSYGTLGFLSKVTLKVLTYKPYVRLEYRPCYSLDETIACFDRETNKNKGNDSVEGIAFTKETSVIMTGNFVDSSAVESDKINRMGLWYKKWFYQYVQDFLERGSGVYVEYVPTLHFHQRHNKPCFWMSHIWLPWADGPLARLLTGWLLPMNYQLLSWLKEKFLGGELEDNFVLQDFILPLQHVKASLELNDTLTNIYPVWLVPARLYLDTLPECIKPAAGDVMFVDVGVYGNTVLPDYVGKDKALRRFEQFTLEHQGFQALYAETLMTKDEFIQMFPSEIYEKARTQFPKTMDAFPEVYDKVSRIGRSKTKTEEKLKQK